MDKAIFLFDKERIFNKEEQIDSKTREELEAAASYDAYIDDNGIVKIDANGFNSIEEAIEDAGFDEEDFYVRAFGF